MSLVSRVEQALSPSGPLAARWPRFEAREGQRALARDIAETVDLGGVRLAEAPTGVGKSMAYLLPAVLHAAEKNERVVIATCTRSLQDQLFDRDLPQLLDVLGVRLPCARLKGKANYVCPVALERAGAELESDPAALDTLRAWAANDADGDLDRFPAADSDVFRRLRGRLGADRHACTAATCRRARECAWVRARRLAAQARIVVVNHALLAVSAGAEGLLPDFDVLIVDEAHRLESVLLAQLERSVSRHRFEEVLRLVGAGRRGSGLVPRLLGFTGPLFESAAREEIERLGGRVTEAREAAEGMFAAIRPAPAGDGPYAARLRHQKTEDLFGRELEPLERALTACAGLERGLRRVALAVGTLDSDAAREMAVEADQVAGQIGGLRDDLDLVTSAADADWVYWRTSSGRGTELHASPIHAGTLARRLVTARARAVVFTSATLRTGGTFDFVSERLGLGEPAGVPCAAAVYPTPFELEKQTATFVLDSPEGEAEAVARVVLELSRAAPRNLLALFTAHERLRRARERLRALPPGRVLLSQELDGPATQVAERFRAERGAILLGVQSLWEGVDFPGDSLEVLVVAKLPFAVPDDPLALARAERLESRGFEPFRHDTLPEAVLRFRQGVGRLIRRADDRGVLVVCDPRLVTASYRKFFLEALPGAPQRVSDARELAARAARFLGGPVGAEGR